MCRPLRKKHRNRKTKQPLQHTARNTLRYTLDVPA